ncbi:MAG: Crp/Fnr family transcriptional regulator [Firmicutes bacterium]|nr:Crp/Fnr family transcriptional regulator [Bacillota bacterium]
MAKNPNIKYLKRIPLFSALTEEELAEIAAVAIERRYQKGRIIFMEGEPGEAIYFLKSGLIKVTKQDEDGREHILHYVNPGDVFAEVVLFDAGGYPATAEVLEDAEVGMIRNKDMDRVLVKNPVMALELLKIMARRLRNAQQQIMELALKDTTRRLAGLLLKLAGDHGVEKSGGVQISLPLTNQELASMVGTSRETVNRILSEFRRKKAVSTTRQGIVVYQSILETWI